MADDAPTVTLAISELEQIGEAGIQQALTDAGFEMAPDLADGYSLPDDLGLGPVNSGLRAMPQTIIELTDDRVTFIQGVYRPTPAVDAEGRTI